MTFLYSLPWRRQIPLRIRIMMPLKAVGTTLFMFLFFRTYFAVLEHPLVPPAIMPLTPVDAWIPFTSLAFPAYVSLWVYVSLPPALMTSFAALWRFGAWCSAMCLTCLALFWFFPTAVPPLPVDWAAHPEMRLLRGVDPGGNACPSLHVASAVFTVFWLQQLLRAMAAPRYAQLLNLLHCALILWSTMAIRQHVFIDVLAGVAVGVVFALFSLRHVGRSAQPGELARLTRAA